MLEILIIWKPLDNHIEFEWKFKFLMKFYESACWHGGNSSYLVAIKPILTFAACWNWCQIHVLLENLWSYMKTWLKYVIFGGHHMGFVSQPVEFGVKFWFLLKIYANYMKRWLKYVLFGGHHMCFGLPSCIELGPKLKLKFETN